MGYIETKKLLGNSEARISLITIWDILKRMLDPLTTNVPAGFNNNMGYIETKWQECTISEHCV